MLKKRGHRLGVVGVTIAMTVTACGGGSDEAADTQAPSEATDVSQTTSAPATTAAPVPTDPTPDDASEDEVEPDTTPQATSAPTTAPTTDAPPKPADGEPIRIGVLVTESGGLNITGNYDALAAYVADYNAAGGLDGRPIELVRADAGLDPATTAAAGSTLVEREQVVALAGGAALLDCLGNGQLYETTGVPVMNAPLDGFCATNQQFFPLGPGADTGLLPAVQWLVESQSAPRVAFVALDLPQSRSGGDMVAATAEGFGGELAIAEYAAFTGNPDIEGIAARIAQASPDGIVSVLSEPLTEALIQALANQGIEIATTPFVAASGLYTQAFIDLVGDAGEGMYLVDSFPLLDSGDPETERMIASINAHIDEPTIDLFEQFGWQAGIVLTAALDALDGAEPTRESITNVLRTLVLDDTLLPATLDFTQFPTTVDPVPGFIAQIQGGRYVQVVGDVIATPVPTG